MPDGFKVTIHNQSGDHVIGWCSVTNKAGVIFGQLEKKKSLAVFQQT